MLVSSGVEMVEYNLIELLLDLLGLAKDDVALAFDRGSLELRVLKDVGQDIYRLGHIGVEGSGEVDGAFALFWGQYRTGL